MNKEEECPICFEKNWISKSPCNHFICLQCLIKLKSDQCPSCRKPLFYSLPNSIKTIVNMTNYQQKNSLNINDLDQFPHL
jgi:hypothetical protein